jgi:outer membrane protein TolC
MTRILTRSGVMTTHFARLFALAIIGSVAMATVIFSYAPVGATPPAGEPSGPYSPPSTHIIYNRDDRDSRAVDQNRLFYENAPNATNNASVTNAPSTLVPSGQGVNAPDQTTTTGATPEAEPGSGTANGQPKSVTSEQEASLEELLPTETELPTHPLTRTRALADALAENYDIRIKVYDEEAAQSLIRQARGAFDPVFSAEGSYEDIRDPQNTQDFIATGGTPGDIVDDMPRIFRENNQHYKIALDGKTEIGTQYEFKSQLDVLSNTLNQTSPLALFTPEWQSFTGVTIDQPFLRGFGTDVNKSEIRAAIVNKLAEKYDVQDQVLSTVSQVMQAYYELTYLSEELEAKREDRDLGVRLVRDRFKALEKGQVSSREVNRVESTLAEIIEDFTKAQNELIDQQTVLAALISSDLDHVGEFVYQPTSEMAEPHLNMNVDQLVTQALLHRPKYLEARERVEEQNIKLVYAHNQTWPQLDLKGTYGVNGLSGSFGNSYYREVIPQGPQWSVGLSFSFVFGNNDAEGKVDEIQARKEQALLNLKQVELDTNLLVRKLVATYRSDEDRYRAMEVFSRTAEENLSDERIRLEKGLSSDLDVLKYRRDSTEAGARRLAALADLNVAYIQIMEATGTLLNNLNIQFSPGAP